SLGECYLRLLNDTRERSWGQRLPELVDLRRIQACAALSQALAIQPDLPQAHFDLGALYAGLGYLDLSLKHRRAYLDLIRKAGPAPGANVVQFDELTAEAEQDLSRTKELVAKRANDFARESAGNRVADRATLAARMGLAAKALDILVASDIAA